MKTGTDLLDPVARAEAPVLRAWPTVRLRDLWEMQELAWGAAARVVAPALVMVAAEDHVVDAAGRAAWCGSSTALRRSATCASRTAPTSCPATGTAPWSLRS